MSGDDNADTGGQQQQTPDNQQGQQDQDQQGQGQQNQDHQPRQEPGPQGDQGNGSAGHDGNTGRPPGGEQTFTQADLDRIVGERLTRQERTKFGDYADLKAQAAELVELKKSQMSDQERAVDTARAEAKAEAAKEYGASLVDAEFRVATTGRMTDDQRVELLAGLDRSRFLTGDNKVDTEKVRTFVDAVRPAAPPVTPPPPVTGGTRMGQGRHPASDKPSLLSGRERFAEQRNKHKTT